MAKSIKYIFVTLFVFTCLISFSKNARAGVPVALDFVQCIDISSSINDAEFELQLRGLSDAVRNVIPDDGSVRFSLIKFGGSLSNGTLVIAPVIITSGNNDSVADDICTPDNGGCASTIVTRGANEGTCTSCCQELAIQVINNATNPTGFTVRTILDISTDGKPTKCVDTDDGNNVDGVFVDGDGCDEEDAEDAALGYGGDAGTLSTAGFDALNALGVGDGIDVTFLENVVFPQPGGAPPPGGDDTDGFVIIVSDFGEYSAAIALKIATEIPLIDLGDAPDTYGTLLAASGPFHIIPPPASNDLYLGSNAPDAEADGLPSAAADGDDMAGDMTIDDGVASFPLGLSNCNGLICEYTLSVTVFNDTGADAFLNSWLDFNGDGDFGEANEQLPAIITVPPAGGSNSDCICTGTQCVCSVTFTNIDLTLVTLDLTIYRARVASDSAHTANSTGFALGGEVEDQLVPINALPVELSQISTRDQGTNILFEWTTATEIMNVGFNLWAHTDDGSKYKLNNELIPSYMTDSLVPQFYSEMVSKHNAVGTITHVGLSTIDIRGIEEFHGPFVLGENYGEKTVPDPIDWKSIRGKVESELHSKQIVLKGNKLRQSKAFIETNASSQAASKSVDAICNVEVSSEGITTVTYKQLRSAGCNFKGVNIGDISVSFKGNGVARDISSGNKNTKFVPGGYIDFYVELPKGPDSLYIEENIYQIKVDKALAIESIPVDRNVSPGDNSYTETAIRENNLIYSFTMPTPNDPWYEARIFSRGSPVSADFIVVTEADAITSDPATLTVGLAGGTAPLNVNPDHHIIIYFHGAQVGEFFNDGVVDWVIDIPLGPNSIIAGENTVRVEVIGRPGTVYPFDIVNLNSIKLFYERPFTAISDVVMFEENSQSDFRVTGLSSDNIAAYGFDGADLYVLKSQITGSGSSFDVSVPSVQSGSPVKYWVSTQDAINSSSVYLARQNTGILDGAADYLIISHPAFIGPELDGYAQNKQSQGFSTKVVDVMDIYDEFGFGMATPFAIREYLIEASTALGFDHVLLVGGDSYDYHDNTNSGVISYIPTMYAVTNSLIFFTPTDSLIVDLDGDEVPDKAVGRWPVRTIDNLKTIIDKTNAFSSKAHNSALMVAEHSSATVVFSNQTDKVAARLPYDPVNIVKIYIDDFLAADPNITISDAIAQARNAMVGVINNGIDMTVFSGHGAPTMWTFNGLMTPSVASSLINAGKPTFVMPLACYTTYHVLPTFNSLSHQLTVAGDYGAVVVTGAISLSSLADNERLANGIIDKMLFEGKTLGQAVLQTKQEPGISSDLKVNWQTLGDPTIRFNN